MNLARLLVRTAQVYPQRPALFLGRTPVCDYRGLAACAAGVGGFLKEQLCLAPGARVALWMSNIPEYLEILYGAWFAGATVVPINSKLHPREVQFILEDSGASVLFASDDLVDGIAPLLRGSGVDVLLVPGSKEYQLMRGSTPMSAPLPRLADDVAWLFYTSGTTGRPKGVMQTNANLLAMTACYFMNVDAVQGEDRLVYAAPLSHAAGMLNFAHMIAGAAHVVPESRSFDPAELIDLSGAHGRLSLFAAPTMIKRLVDKVMESKADPSGFKTIVYGGGPMYVEDLRQALDVMGDRFVQIYGQGESPMTITALGRAHLSDRSHPRYLDRIASVGVAQSLVEVRVADPLGEPVPVGETGEIIVRGPTVMKGYWNNPDATARTVRDGWLYTGDMGSFDADGFLTLKDRSKDVIISGGSNIYPREIEEILLQHPQVDEVSVVGRRHDEWGEEVVAFVVLKSKAAIDRSDLDALCLQNIARFKRPKEYLFVDTLPKNSYGKVLKTDLRGQLTGGVG